MNKLSRYRVLICGILSPFAALFLYASVYATLTRRPRRPRKGLALPSFRLHTRHDRAFSRDLVLCY